MHKNLIEEIHKERGTKLHTRDDVSFVLSFIAPPGEKRELKKEIIDVLFPGVSFQGYKTSNDLDSYAEY